MEIEFKKIPNKISSIFYATLLCCLVFLMTYDLSSRIRHTLKQERIEKEASGIWKWAKNVLFESLNKKSTLCSHSWFTRQTLLENGRPLCDGKLLNRKNYADIKRTGKISRSNPSDSSKELCRLFHFNIDHVVTCLDHLYYQNQFFRGFTDNGTFGTFPSAELIFLFVGDSRVRQQFYYFLKVKSILIELLFRINK